METFSYFVMELFWFLYQNIVAMKELVYLIPLSVVYSAGLLFVAGTFKLRYGWDVAYTRKIVHYAIFLSVAVLQSFGGLPAVLCFGVGTALTLGFAVWRRDGFVLYESMARERDGVNRHIWVIVPAICTALGGISSNFFFSDFAIFGYLVAGIGDGLGEPVGRRYGNIRFTALRGNAARKTFAGTKAVWFGILFAFVLGAILTGSSVDGYTFLMLCAAVTICTIVEVFAPRGTDNLFLQVIPAGLAFLILS